VSSAINYESMTVYYCIFSDGTKILYKAHSVKHAKSIKTRYCKLYSVSYVIGGKAYTLIQSGEKMKEYKYVHNHFFNELLPWE
jgi:hypothetical protein